MAKYTPEEFDAVISKFVSELPKAMAQGTFLAAQQLYAEIPQRIFNKGKAVDGSDIGEYSTTTTLVGRKSFPTKGTADRFFGKKDQLQWRRFKGRNLALLEGGYKELRRLSDLQTDKVDLNFRGDLQGSFALVEYGPTDFAIIIKGAENVAKARGNEKHFKGATNTIFHYSKDEEKKAQKAYNVPINKLIRKYFD